MAKKKPLANTRPASIPASVARDTARPSGGAEPVRPSGARELVESLVIAFVLAFLFRTFEAEAFQIPTGSMGPTLMGRHKEVDCPMCGHIYQVGTSEEVDQDTSLPIRQNEVVACTCPICRFTTSVGPDDPQESTPSYKGDRIWVNKAIYESDDPKRWDVAVFKFPVQGDVNYIKRIVGLPGETVELLRGDVYQWDAQAPRMVAKPGPKVLAMMQPVDDSAQVVDALLDAGFPSRWGASAGAQWTTADRGRSFVLEQPVQSPEWLRFSNYVPSYEDWQKIEQQKPLGETPRPQLISDYCAFNTSARIGYEGQPRPDRAPSGSALGLHWVGDLILEVDLELAGHSGQALLELVEAGRRFQCQVDLATGQGTMLLVGEPAWSQKFSTELRGPGRFALRLANVDDRLLLWIDDELVAEADYSALGLASLVPTADDLSPAAVAVQGSRATARNLRIFRDVYYVAYGFEESFQGLMPISDLLSYSRRNTWDVPRGEVATLLSTPDMWPQAYGQKNRRWRLYELEDDEFLALGDNSPNSSDSRFWPSDASLSRDLLIGKAMFVYWPHAWPVYPHFRMRFRGNEYDVPFYPNFKRMRLIR